MLQFLDNVLRTPLTAPEIVLRPLDIHRYPSQLPQHTQKANYWSFPFFLWEKYCEFRTLR